MKGSIPETFRRFMYLGACPRIDSFAQRIFK
jgi:hypothetical protein